MISLNFTLRVAGHLDDALEDPPQACQDENDNIQLVVAVVGSDGNAVNLLNATSLKLLLLTPGGTTLERTAAFVTTGVDGLIEYATTVDDMRQTGTYQLQVEYTLDGDVQTTRRGKFLVLENIED